MVSAHTNTHFFSSHPSTHSPHISPFLSPRRSPFHPSLSRHIPILLHPSTHSPHFSPFLSHRRSPFHLPLPKHTPFSPHPSLYSPHLPPFLHPDVQLPRVGHPSLEYARLRHAVLLREYPRLRLHPESPYLRRGAPRTLPLRPGSRQYYQLHSSSGRDLWGWYCFFVCVSGLLKTKKRKG